IVQRGFEIGNIGFQLVVQRSTASADDVVDLFGFLREGKAVRWLFGQRIERPDTPILWLFQRDQRFFARNGSNGRGLAGRNRGCDPVSRRGGRSRHHRSISLTSKV